MRTRTDPPLDAWPTPSAQRPVWTGHQASLFHPGILAKYFAAADVSRRAGVPAAQVSVDQDVFDPLTLTVPVRDGDRLAVQPFALGPRFPGGSGVPLASRPPVRADVVAKNLRDWPGRAAAAPDRARLVEAFAESERESQTLGQQMDRVLRRLLPEVYGPSVFASDLLRDEADLLDRLLHDAPRCVADYNRSTKEFPAAGISPMSVEPDRVEVPLWALRWKSPRRRVYVDVADSTPIFVTEDGEPLSQDVVLAPRALLMTALLRRPDRCALFIHGTGGGDYDRITECWWSAWQGQKLAPLAVVTADLHLGFDAPVNTAEEVRRAVWAAHHLPHNLDRELKLDTSFEGLAREKRELLDRMDDDRDKKRRRAAFEAVHRINRDLAAAHPGALDAARRDLERARAGLANAAVARRRDWSFLLYPAEQLETLRGALAYKPASAATSPAPGR